MTMTMTTRKGKRKRKRNRTVLLGGTADRAIRGATVLAPATMLVPAEGAQRRRAPRSPWQI